MEKLKKKYYEIKLYINAHKKDIQNFWNTCKKVVIFTVGVVPCICTWGILLYLLLQLILFSHDLYIFIFQHSQCGIFGNIVKYLPPIFQPSQKWWLCLAKVPIFLSVLICCSFCAINKLWGVTTSMDNLKLCDIQRLWQNYGWSLLGVLLIIWANDPHYLGLVGLISIPIVHSFLFFVCGTFGATAMLFKEIEEIENTDWDDEDWDDEDWDDEDWDDEDYSHQGPSTYELECLRYQQEKEQRRLEAQIEQRLRAEQIRRDTEEQRRQRDLRYQQIQKEQQEQREKAKRESERVFQEAREQREREKAELQRKRQTIHYAEQLNSNSVRVKMEDGSGWFQPGRLLSYSPSTVSIEYSGWVRIYGPRGNVISSNRVR